jgi:hypothetical protein
MTAINPARLKIQCVELGNSFNDIPGFISGLHDLLVFYSARIRHTDLSKTPLGLQTYQVPAPVLRALEIELSDVTKIDPVQGLKLIDALWQEDWLEIRQLSISLLGYIPTTTPGKILDRIQLWISKSPSEELNRQIMTKAIAKLAAEKPSRVLRVLKTLASKATRADQQSAVFGLMLFAQQPDFEDLPKIYQILKDILIINETGLTKDIAALIHLLQKKSDQETAYFLVRQLAFASKPRIFKIIRQVLPNFSEDSQRLLREKLDSYS